MKVRSLLYSLLLLTEVPDRWRAWQVALVPAGLAAATGLAWGQAGGAAVGWIAGLGLGALAAVDWWLLASLPRRGLSFGPVRAPFLGLSLVRALAALTLLPLVPLAPGVALGLLAGVQLLGLGLAAYGLLIEPFRLSVTRLVVHSARLSNPGSPLCVVHLSDLHVERLTRRERALPGLVAGLAPDLIVLTGDYLNASFKRDPQALADLEWLLSGLHAPGGIVACLGTSTVDSPELLRPVLARAGVVLLENEARVLELGGHRLWIAGVNCTRDPAADGERLRSLLAAAPEGAYRLVLYHMPDLMPEAAALGVDLVLAGHTHGGQWRLPGVGALLTDSRYGKRYEAGAYRQGSTHMVVSRGLGMEGFGTPRARFFCAPEVVSLTLTGEAG
jgi:hypothetical protein